MSYLNKLRKLIVSIIAFIYLVLFIFKSPILPKISTPLLFIFLTNQAIEQWLYFKETNKKIFLIIPISFIFIILFILINLIIR